MDNDKELIEDENKKNESKNYFNDIEFLELAGALAREYKKIHSQNASLYPKHSSNLDDDNLKEDIIKQSK